MIESTFVIMKQLFENVLCVIWFQSGTKFVNISPTLVILIFDYRIGNPFLRVMLTLLALCNLFVAFMHLVSHLKFLTIGHLPASTGLQHSFFILVSYAFPSVL
uniref:Ovule protein n=1 Tax=Mesocestoides corti TaxID=53468 RepID=A0A5K3FCB9_MESCO